MNRIQACILTALGVSHLALAQTALPRIDLQRLALDPSALGSLVVGDGQVLEQGHYRLGLAGQYERAPLVLYANGQSVGDIVANRATGYVLAALGVLPNLELHLQLPVIAFQNGDDLTGYGVSAVAHSGLDTGWAGVRYQLLSSSRSPVDLGVHLAVGVPVGTDSALGNGGLAFDPRVMVSHPFEEFLLSGQVSALFRQKTAVGPNTLGDQVGADLSLAWIGASARHQLGARLAVPLADYSPSVEVLAGARLPISRYVEGFALAGPGFGTLPGTPAFRALVGVALHDPRSAPEPAAPAPAPIDPCAPGQAHTPAQCPDLDDDGDGIRNADDKCPLEKGVAHYHGCPIPDRDHDGVPDDVDRCPDEPWPKERQGCPFHDRDGDGIEDAIDACPDQPGPPETRGCPIKDTDGDGIPDHLDNCPNEPGPASNQGCPVKKKQLVVITSERLQIKDAVYFDTNQASIQARSYPLLNQIATVIKDHPNITLIRIEGHTDNTGAADTNRKLSQARAEAVCRYIAAHGVEAERMQPKGFGPDFPIAPNDTAKGRALNRRVEFNLVNPTPHHIEAIPQEEQDGGKKP